jgi:hypothetical protein
MPMNVPTERMLDWYHPRMAPLVIGIDFAAGCRLTLNQYHILEVEEGRSHSFLDPHKVCVSV